MYVLFREVLQVYQFLIHFSMRECTQHVEHRKKSKTVEVVRNQKNNSIAFRFRRTPHLVLSVKLIVWRFIGTTSLSPVSSYVWISCRLHKIANRLLRIAYHYDRMRASTVESQHAMGTENGRKKQHIPNFRRSQISWFLPKISIFV